MQSARNPPAGRPAAAPSARDSSNAAARRAVPNRPRLDTPPASSVYSQDISPPDSPRTGDDAQSSSPNVSPITDGGSIHRGHSSGNRTYTSSIPMPTQQPGGVAAKVAGWREKLGASQGLSKSDSRRTKWDTYSGEPTDSEKGRHGQTTPATAGFDKSGADPAAGPQTPSKSGMFTHALKKVVKKEPDTSPPPREAWKGASGRETIVAPVADKPDARTKALPTPSERRKQQGLRQTQGLRHALVGKISPVKESKAAAASPTQTQTESAPTTFSSPTSPTDTIRPPPESIDAAAVGGPNTPRRTESPGVIQRTDSPGVIQRTDSPGVPSHTDSPGDFPQRSDSHLPLSPAVQLSTPLPPRKDSQQLQAAPFTTPSPAATKQPPLAHSVAAREAIRASPSDANQARFSDAQITSAFEQLAMYNEPGSRFSTTTYATTVADSPPGSPGSPDQASMPPVPSILNRKRPVPSSSATFSHRTPSRKPTPSEINMQDNKAMPAPPPDAEPVDKITLLEAKLNSLHKRKANIQTVINELTNVVQPSSISYDIASRGEIKKTVTGLEVEQAQIEKEIHETGLQLHRAQKRRDKDAYFESTGLWVHRVTQ